MKDYASLTNKAEETLQLVKDQEKALGSVYDKLAKSEKQIPDDLRHDIDEKLSSLKQTSILMKDSLQRVRRMEDELSARLMDGRKSVERKWYLPNPPSNGSIDLLEQESQHFARGLNLYKLILILVIGSFAGVVVELIWCYLNHGYFESRNGLVYGPFNLLYGVGAAALSVALYRFRNRGRWLSFAGGMLIGSVVEYLCSWWMEAAFGSKSWDYSAHPFNLNGRICLLYSVFWGLLGVIWIKDIYPRMAKWIMKLPDRFGRILTWSLALFMLINCLVSGAAVLRWSERKRSVPADNQVRIILDQSFPDERMERIYANMEFFE